MKSLRPRVTLDRDAVKDVWRKTLSHIPSVLGRLVYLSNLRNTHSGRYEHHGLSAVAGEEASERALRESHLQAFQEWIVFSLEEQKADLDLYFSALEQSRREVLEHWILAMPYYSLVPATIHGVERDLFIADIGALLDAAKNASGVAGPDREA